MANKKTVNVHTCVLSFEVPNQTFQDLRNHGSLDGQFQDEFMSLFSDDAVSDSSEAELRTIKLDGMIKVELDTSETQFIALTKRLRAVSDKVNQFIVDAAKVCLDAV